jgi:hypothetical protein
VDEDFFHGGSYISRGAPETTQKRKRERTEKTEKDGKNGERECLFSPCFRLFRPFPRFFFAADV